MTTLLIFGVIAECLHTGLCTFPRTLYLWQKARYVLRRRNAFQARAAYHSAHIARCTALLSNRFIENRRFLAAHKRTCCSKTELSEQLPFYLPRLDSHTVAIASEQALLSGYPAGCPQPKPVISPIRRSCLRVLQTRKCTQMSGCIRANGSSAAFAEVLVTALNKRTLLGWICGYFFLCSSFAYAVT